MRARLLILASSLAMLAWGTVLPYQFAYAAQTRGWGGFVAAITATFFSVGALIAAPLAGRLADRVSPARVAIAARVLAALALSGLVLADSPATFLLGMLLFGVTYSAAMPAQAVLVLRWSKPEERRRVFAWQFTGQALGMAIGSLVAGQFVDLTRETGMDWAFLLGAAGFAAAAVLLAIAARGDSRPVREGSPADVDVTQTSGRETLRVLWASRPLRWAALVTVSLALGFYAQFETGLPALALTEMHVETPVIGYAAAVNCLVIVALQVIVTRRTERQHAGVLLQVVGGIWVLAWLVLIVAMHAPSMSATLFVAVYGIFAVGETMWAPVLNPLAASLAPNGMVGATLGTLTALQTGFSAVGPLVAGVLLGAGHSNAFVVIHLLISLTAVYGARRLYLAMRASGVPGRASAEVTVPDSPAGLGDSLDDGLTGGVAAAH